MPLRKNQNGIRKACIFTMKQKRKIINIIIDLVLITGIFTLVDILSIKVFRSESIWLHIGLYIMLYIAVFGVKSGIVVLLKRKKINGPVDKDK